VLCVINTLGETVSKLREVKHEFKELSIPEGRRVLYFGNVVKVERFYHRVKPLKIKGKVRYGTVQIIFPKDCVNRPVYIIAYVLLDSEKLGESYTPSATRPGKLPLEKIA
jgi:hypothetical protein